MVIKMQKSCIGRVFLIIAVAFVSLQQVSLQVLADEQQLQNQVHELSRNIDGLRNELAASQQGQAQANERAAELERTKESLVNEVRHWRDVEVPNLERKLNEEHANTCNNEKRALEEQIRGDLNGCQQKMTEIQQQSERELAICNEHIATERASVQELTSVAEHHLNTCTEKVKELESTSGEAITAKEQLNSELRQLKEHIIPSMETKFQEDLNSCQLQAEQTKQAETARCAQFEKEANQQITSLESRVEKLSAENQRLDKVVESTRKELEEMKTKYFDARQESAAEKKKFRDLREELDATVLFFNFPLFQQRVTGFYNEYIEPTLTPAIKQLSELYTKSIKPVVGPKLAATQDMLQNHTLPLVKDTFHDITRPLVQVLEEKNILPEIRKIIAKFVKFVHPYHIKYTTALMEASHVAENFFRLNDYPLVLINAAAYVHKNPENVSIWYYRVMGFLIFYVFFASLLLRNQEKPKPVSKKQLHQNGQVKGKKGKNLYETESTKNKKKHQ